MQQLARLALTVALITGMGVARAGSTTLNLAYYDVTLLNSDATSESGTGSVSFADGLISITGGDLTGFSFALSLDGPSGTEVITFGQPDLGSFTATLDPAGVLTALTFYTSGRPSRYAINGDAVEDIVVNGLGAGQGATHNGVVVSFGDVAGVLVPEPPGGIIIGLGLAGCVVVRRRNRPA